METEVTAGVILVLMTILALSIVNSPLGGLYEHILHVPISIGVGDSKLEMGLLHWINDALMAVFFLLVALEIKREILAGELSRPGQVMLPVIAAAGGMLVPALIYVAFNYNDSFLIRGWATPSATDIAFSLGILSVLGRRVPLSLKVFLAALAIIDDLGAIVIIAFFYTADLSIGSLGLAGLAFVGLLALNRLRVSSLLPYWVVGAFLWVFMLQSGIHATIAGVLLGITIPLTIPGHGHFSPLRRLEKTLHPWVAFAILPIFALANAGVPLAGMDWSVFQHPVFLGVALGLFVGKQCGVFGLSWIAIHLGWVQKPDGANYWQLYGVAILTGIGFTMSLFIDGLAFGGEGPAVMGRSGVLVGSLMSAVVGLIFLARVCPVPQKLTFKDKEADLTLP